MIGLLLKQVVLTVITYYVAEHIKKVLDEQNTGSGINDFARYVNNLLKS